MFQKFVVGGMGENRDLELVFPFRVVVNVVEMAVCVPDGERDKAVVFQSLGALEQLVGVDGRVNDGERARGFINQQKSIGFEWPGVLNMNGEWHKRSKCLKTRGNG